MIGDSTIHAVSINGNVSTNTNIEGTVSVNSINLSADIDLGKINIIHSDLPHYEGEYSVTPKSDAQTLDTDHKTLTEDITINPIPYYSVANQYGRTVYIGGS